MILVKARGVNTPKDTKKGLIPIVFIYCADGCHCERSEAISLPFVFEIATATLGGLAMTVRRYY